VLNGPPPDAVAMTPGSHAPSGPEPARRSLGRALVARAPRIVVSLVIAVGFVWALRRGGLPLVPDRAALATVKWWTVPAYAAAVAGAMFFRTYRWIHLLRPIAPELPALRVLGVGLVGFTAVFFAPLRTGEIARPYLIAQDGRIRFFQAVGTVGAERVIDGLVLMTVGFGGLALAVPISPLPDHLGDLPLPVAAVPAALFGTLLVFVAAFAATLLFYRVRHFARRVTRRALGLASERLAGWVTTTLERLADGLTFLGSRLHLQRFSRDTLCYWTLAVFGQWLLLRGSGFHASAAEACVTLGVMGVGSLLPAGPGFFGAFQIGAFTGLALFYDQALLPSSGAAFVFVGYTVQIAVNVLACVAGFWLLSRSPAAATAVEPSAESS
jgi:hypothetical protein